MAEQSGQPDQPDRVIIRDKRRIDPVTGLAREPVAADFAGTGSDLGANKDAGRSLPNDEIAALEAAVAERTADLQRLQAEYANYRKRVDRDRISVRDFAVRDVLVALLPILDDIDRARSHGDLSGAFKAVADQLDVVLTKVGLEAFGVVGDPFDPSIHEAVTHAESDEVTEPTATMIMRQGYRHADRLVRPAMVGVSEPVHVASHAATDAVTETDDGADTQA